MNKQNCPEHWVKYIIESELPGWYLEGVSKVLMAWLLAGKELMSVKTYFDSLYQLLDGTQKNKQLVFNEACKKILPNTTWKEEDLIDSLSVNWSTIYFTAMAYSLKENGSYSLDQTKQIYQKINMLGKINGSGKLTSTSESDFFEDVMKLEIREKFLKEPLTFERKMEYATAAIELQEGKRVNWFIYCPELVKKSIECELTPEEMIETGLRDDKINQLGARKHFQWMLDVFNFNEYNLMFHKQYYKESTQRTLDALQEVRDNTHCGDLFLMEPCVTMTAKISGKAVKVVLMKSNKIRCSYRGYEGINDENSVQLEYDFLIYANGAVFEKKKNGYMPVTYRTLKRVRENMFDAGEKLYKAIINHLIESGTYVAKDLDKYLYSESGMYSYFDLIPSFTINETLGCKNLNQLCKKKWKGGQDINWNKIDLNAAYLMMKTKTRIRPEDREKFIQNASRMFKAKAFDTDRALQNIKAYTEEFLATYLSKMIYGDKNTFLESSISGLVFNHSYSELMCTARDYVHTQMLLKEKVNINFKSEKKLTEAHDAATAKYEEKDMSVRIPKNSKFKALRKMLPIEMEWIKTAKRLRQEGKEMHHCVYTYADKINADACAIYSMTYADKRYTIEFTKNNDIFEIRQLQSACNKGAPQEVQDYVLDLLKKKQGKIQENKNITAVRCAGHYEHRPARNRRNVNDDFDWDMPF